MALAILDGTQTATTLSTILSSGQHITAHTVVSLGTQAKTDILSAVSSGIAISGTVTANSGANFDVRVTQGGDPVDSDNAFPIYGTVTANVFGKESFENTFVPIQIGASGEGFGNGNRIGVALINDAGTEHGTTGTPLNISGTVTIGSALPAGTNRIGVVTASLSAGTAQIGSVTASISGTVPVSISSVTVGNSVTIGSLPALVAGTAQIGSVTASLAISSTAITSGSFTSLTSATLVPGNVARKMATVYNLGAGQLFVNAGSSATTLGGGFMVALSSGDYFECDFTTTTLSALFATAGTASWVSH